MLRLGVGGEGLRGGEGFGGADGGNETERNEFCFYKEMEIRVLDRVKLGVFKENEALCHPLEGETETELLGPQI